MSVGRVCYATREAVMRSLDIKWTARNADAIDRAIEAASDNIDGELHRKFYPEDTTRYFDWPNYQYAYPWRIWFDQSELADVTTNVPVVTTGSAGGHNGSGTTIPNSQIFWGHPNDNPPYTYLELDRSTTAAFGLGPTPQRDVAITGTFGYWIKTNNAGTLSVAVSSTSSTSVTVSNGAAVGVGDMLLADSERMIVADKFMTDTSVSDWAGCTTTSASDNVLTVPDGTKFAVYETVMIDTERMLIVDIVGNNLTVKRAWDGTVLETHTSGDIYAARLLTVTRGDLGTTAATHTQGISLYTNRVPPLVRDLAVAEAGVQVLEEIGGYSDPQGETGTESVKALGTALADKWDEAEARYGRKARVRVI